MNAGEAGMAATVIASILLAWWIVRDSRKHNQRLTQEQERELIIERCRFAPQSRAELRAE